MMMLRKAVVLCLLPLILVGCGGNNSSSSGNQRTPGQAQGVYEGTTSSGYNFDAIVLPNDKFFAIYGANTTVDGMMTGQGTSGASTYTANVTDFYYTGQTCTGSVSASYVAGSSLNGTLTENCVATQTFSGTSLPASSFNYNTPASLSAISGTWTGVLLDGASATVTIGSNGNFSGSDSGCTFSGTITPDSSNKNFFDMSLTFGGPPCLDPNQTASGIAVDYLLSDGVTRQLLAAVTGTSSGTSWGTVFAANR